MKNPISSIAIVCALALATSCKKKTDLDFNFPDKPQSSASNASHDDLGALLRSAANKPETFTVNATTGGQFTSSKGITYTIDPGIFVKPNGETAQGDVQVTVQEVTQASEMILNDMPTNAIVSPDDNNTTPIDSVQNPKDTLNPKDTTTTTTEPDKGGMLNSYGEIKIDATQGGYSLELKPDATIDAEIPQTVVPEPIIQTISIPMWSPAIVTQSNLKGHDFENKEVYDNVNVTSKVTSGMTWIEIPNIPPVVCVANEIPSIIVQIDEIGEWRNADVLLPSTRPTTVLGYFTNVFNEIDSTEALQGIQSNMLFFKKKDDNVLVKLYDHILNAPKNKQGLLSYQNSFEIGMEGTFLALVSKDGKYYAQKKATTIGEPENGKNYVGIDFTLEEVTKDEMFALIQSMSNE